ncbi:MAG TPA: hypothetical protein VM841_15685 [Actinomycetota bacterium]|nr:hypothetical protein [Actinomycetota bacterium]
MILIGTKNGLVTSDGTALLEGDVTHVIDGEDGAWVLTTEQILQGEPDALRAVAPLDGIEANCLLPSRHGLFVGAADARLYRLDGSSLQRVESFDQVQDRDTWHTPWGGPPDVRSMTEAPDGTIYAGVHVGGIVRSRDGGETWTPTIDIDTDIHQVITHDDLVIAPGWNALHVSEDAGETWTEHRDGFDHTYMRAVAIAGDALLVSAAYSHAGKDAGVYRRDLRGDGPFERIEPVHPSEHNIDTFWLAANGSQAAFVTAEGELYRSTDRGRTWSRAARGLALPRCLALRE